MKAKICAFSLLIATPLIGLKAAVNPDGSFSYSIPIELPSGRQGLQPQLALSYNSNSPNGIYGVGWNLQGLSAITRINYGNGITYTNSDTFASPEGRLIQVTSGIYHAANESWAKYVSGGNCGGGPCFWTVTDRSGVTFHYGLTDNSRIVAKDSNNTQINGGAIRVWALERVIDLNGNYYEITYTHDDYGQYYPEKINYTMGAGASKNYVISFFYDETGRPDKEINYSQSAHVKTNWRLSKIAIDHQASCFAFFTCNDRIKSYVLNYENRANLRLSRLISWQEFNADNLGLPPLQFNWGDTTGFSAYSQAGSGFLNTGATVNRYAIDLNGDGKVDYLQISSGNAWVWINNGSGFNAYQNWGTGFLNDSSVSQGYPVDLNADGKIDYLQISNGDAWAWINNGNGFNAYQNWGTGFATSSTPHKGFVVDLNADGKPDYLQISTTTAWAWINNGTGFSAFAIWGTGFAIASTTADGYAIDLNGDGRADYLQISSGNAWVWINNGNGFNAYQNWGTGFLNNSDISQGYPVDLNADGRIDFLQISNGDAWAWINNGDGFNAYQNWGTGFATSATPNKGFVVDLNADGKPDYLQVSTTNAWAWINNGTGFTTYANWGTGFADSNTTADGYAVDFNGDGKADYLQISSGNAWVWRNNTDGANTIASISLPSGRITNIQYLGIGEFSSGVCPSTCTSPDTTSLTYTQGIPNAVGHLVVSKETTTNNMNLDDISGLDSFVTSYSYYNSRVTTGTFLERASLGFEKIKTTDLNSGNYKIDTYRQDKPFHGRLAKTASFLSTDAKVSETLYPNLEQYYCTSETGCNTTPNNPPVAEPTSPQQIRPIVISGNGTVSRSFEGPKASEVETGRKQELITAFDEFGNPTEITQTISGGTATPKTTYRSIQYINPTTAQAHIIGLVYNEKLCLNAGNCVAGSADSLSETNTFYDYAMETNTAILRKLITKKESFLSTDNNGAGVWVPETYLYDNLGNITQKIDAQGIKTTIVYDNDYKQYPISVTKLHMGNSSVMAYDYDFRFGKKISETNNDDGTITLNTIDASGFVTQVQTQNGATIIAKKTFAHSPFGTTPIWTQECTFYGSTFTSSSCRRKFTDALGRAYREEYPELVAGVEQQMAIERRYDSLGRETYISQPKLASATFGAPNAPGEWSRKIYDTQNRLTDTISFDSKTTHTDYQNASSASGPYGAAPTDSVSCTITRAPDLTRKRSCDGIEGKPVRVEESYGTSQQTTVLYHYDSLNRLTSVTSPQNTVTTLIYLGRSQLQQSIIDPVAGTTSYEYYLTPLQASFAKLKKETRPASTSGTVSTDLEYNTSFGRLSKTTKADSVTNYTYDETSLSYGKGRLTTQEHIVDGYTIQDRYSYNDRGETTNTTRRIWNPADQSCPNANVNTMPCLQTFGAVKDELGRIKTMTYPDGKVTAIEYMPGSTKNIYRIKHDGTTYATYSDYTFDIMAHVKKITYGNGLVHDYDYHPLNSVDPQRPPGLLQSITMGKANQDPYLNLELTYDVNLNIQRIDDHVIPAWTTEYHYDSLNRLKDAKLDADGYIGTTYRYYKFDNQNAAESKGNLEIKADRQFTYPSGKTYPTSGQAWDSGTQTASGPVSTYTWSGNGNLLTKGPLTFTYDSNNMLKEAVEVDGSSATVGDTTFFYDQSGQRFLKKHTRGGVTIKTWYLGDGLEMREKYVGVTSGTPNGTYDSSQTTKYIYGIDNKKLASITGNVYTAALSATSESMMALADGYSSSTVSGLASKAFYTFYGIYAHENFAKTARITALLALLLMLGIWLVRSHRRSREEGGAYMPLWLRGTALTLVLPVFTLVNCNWLQIPSGVTPGDVNTMVSELYTGLPAGTVYYSHNHLGSGNLVTDAAGNEVFRITYDEYGQIDLEKSGKFNPTTGLIEHDVDAAKILITAVKYTGQEYDPETGLYYYNARYYDPQLGVFTTADSDFDLNARNFGFNRHMYVAGNPIKYSDPTGYNIFEDFGNWVSKAWEDTKKWVSENWKKAVVAVVVVATSIVTAGAAAAIFGAAYATTLTGAIVTGAFVGAGAGFAGSATEAWLDGKSFGEGLVAGFGGAAIGAVGGAIGGAAEFGVSKLLEKFPSLIIQNHDKLMQTMKGPWKAGLSPLESITNSIFKIGSGFYGGLAGAAVGSIVESSIRNKDAGDLGKDAGIASLFGGVGGVFGGATSEAMQKKEENFQAAARRNKNYSGQKTDTDLAALITSKVRTSTPRIAFANKFIRFDQAREIQW